MSESIKIKIYGRMYNLKSASFSADPEEVAALVDSKMHELSGVGGVSTTSDLALLAALNLAQEVLELKKAGENDDNRIEQLIATLEKKVENQNL